MSTILEKIRAAVDGPSMTFEPAQKIDDDGGGIAAEKKFEPEKKFSEKNFQCSLCQSSDLWLPRAPGIDETKPDNWRCWKCSPPNSSNIVLRRRGPAWDALRREEAESRALERQNALQTIVEALEKPACVTCGGSWVIERPSPLGVDRICWSCQQPIEPADYWAAVERPKPKPITRRLYLENAREKRRQKDGDKKLPG